MFDGEGSLSLAVGGGSPKLSMTQALGPVLDRAEAVMSTFGYEPYRCVTAASGQDGRKKLAQLFIPGGFPGVMRVLGELRPMRLLDKWDTLDFSDRSVEATPIEVLRVESAGVRDIQEITTSEGTYLGEGYLMHNCGDYANGPTPTTKTKGRRDYGISLGRALSENNLARYTGRPRKADEYWELHAEAVKHWPDRVIVNVDEPICERWIELLHDAGYPLCSVTRAYTQRYAGLANADVRAEFEVVILAER